VVHGLKIAALGYLAALMVEKNDMSYRDCLMLCIELQKLALLPATRTEGKTVSEFQLTEQQKDWFGERMRESRSGRVIIPTYLFDKYRKLADDPTIPNHKVKCILIDQCY
jgi:hypothetical protein